MGFIHLRSHSCYSFLRGLPSPQELAQAAANLGMPALGLTDHHSLSGAIEFHDACVESGIKPILGMEVESAPPPALENIEPGSLILLAMDMLGGGGLCRIRTSLGGERE